MELSFTARARNAWNAFMGRNEQPLRDRGPTFYARPDRPRFSRGNEKSIVNSVFNRIALDVASVEIRHVRLDKDGRYTEDVDSGLNNCLSLEANVDQTARSFILDTVISMFDEGVVALVPIDTDVDPENHNSVDVITMRVGKILDWAPQTVKVRVYNDRSGRKEELVLQKSNVAIVENPFYPVVNESNSTLQRLIRKLAILDVVDEQCGSNSLDLIIQLPYTIRSQARRDEADKRRKDLEGQLRESKYGVGYIDGTEKITQLNRPVENNLLKQVEYLTNMLYSQLGVTQAIMDGTADDKAMTNYYSRTVETILLAITEELKRKFLTKTARAQGQTIRFYRDPFRLVPVADLAEISDKMIRNQIMSANEMRSKIGLKPSSDPKSDELINPNISHPDDRGGTKPVAEEEIQNG